MLCCLPIISDSAGLCANPVAVLSPDHFVFPPSCWCFASSAHPFAIGFSSSPQTGPTCPWPLSFLVMGASLLAYSSIVHSVAGLFLFTLRTLHQLERKMYLLFRKCCPLGGKGLVSWQCQSEDPSLLETDKTPLSGELPVSSSESRASQTWGVTPGAHEIIG